ncbi:hypothetical protein TTHERM_00123860 (macronuclear) [Tetrahymena thermophila SB210]|uniref:Uncharacterized protein n=1 Tax=Tetrahymena thermophila (strain SB210) TaxID=312017 RepID=Q22YN5_TETTS|nr:hypothetical protein TTHERM_00123860 [Tetrahymena thermophila SB210]EAR90636.2 hypothetical protein TTHERM_00123860 [Tetrahymena thermophila SB210]|eukprot:XP_001010881.2 hypothetical protein TTHERM_00123860 [Tetrahymena thermophila SB210]
MISPSVSSVQTSTGCSLSTISLNSVNQTTGIVNDCKQESIIALMDIICEEQSKNRRFCFPKQKVVLQNEQTVINLKKTFDLSDALKIVLTDSVLFKFDEKNTQIYIGVYNQQSIEDPECQLLLDLNEESLKLNQVHLSFYRKKEINNDKVAFKAANQDCENTPKFNRKRNLDELDSNSSQITFVHISNNPSLNRKDSCLSQNSNQAANQNQEYENSYKKKKLNSSNPQNIVHSQSNVGFKTEFEDASSEQKDYSSNKSHRKDEDKASQKKSQERTIKEALEMVCKWRDLQDFYKTNSITKDYQSVADEIGISKKTLDYYYLELRTAEYFCFDFDSNLDKKMGILRDYIQESKKNFQNQFSTHKIPRNSTLKYRIPKKIEDSSLQQTNIQPQIERLQSSQYQQQSNFTSANQNSINLSSNNSQANIQTQGYNSNLNINKNLQNLNSSSHLNQKCFYDQQIILPSLSSPNQSQSQQQYKETQLNQSSFQASNTNYPNNHNIIQNTSNQQNIPHINQNNSYTNSTNYYNDHSYTQKHATSQLSSQSQQFIPNNEIYQNFFNNTQSDYPMNQQRISFQLQDQSMDYNHQCTLNQQNSSQGAFQDSLMQKSYNANSCGNSNNFNNNNNQNGRIHSCQQILHSFI